MPLRPNERLKTTYTLLSNQPNSPRSVIIGRHEEKSQKYIESNSSPGPSQCQTLKVWSEDPNRKGPRIGSESIGSLTANPRIGYTADSMLGSTLRSKPIDAPIYDPQPGMGDWSPRKPAAVMCGSHGRYASNSKSAAANSEDGTFSGSVAPTPGPQSYYSDYNSMGFKARKKRMESMAAIGACTFGRRWGDKKDNGVPGPGQYETEDYSKTMSPYPTDENPGGLYGDSKGRSRSETRNSARSSRSNTPRQHQQHSSRPSTVLSPYQTQSSRGKSFGLRHGSSSYKNNSERPETSPGPGEYSPRLPFISSSNARTPSLKGRQPHPFVDHLAAHDCAKATYNHSTRGASRMKARVRAT